ncbi:MAG TPA: hypothetical protein VM509_15095 [Planctomycetota bacterium]|nr:hypothetical protein [Planctomycetota bacterium]
MSGHKSIGRPRRELERGARSGKFALGAVIVLALVASALFAAWRMNQPAPERAAPELSPIAPSDAPATSGAAPMTIEPIEVGRSAKLPRPEPRAFDPARLEGRGRLRGFVQAPPGVEFPQEWTLSVLPSTSLIGKERAETRVLEFHAGEQEFDVPDLAFGGYMLRASAFGLASDEQHMLLAKPSETELYVLMQLSVTTFVEGQVRFEDYLPASGLELALEPRPAGVRAVVKTDISGHFLFTDVKAGGYTLHVGNPETPVREPLEVNVGGGPEHVKDVVLPKLGELVVRVLAAPGAPAQGVKLEGYGDQGGRIDGLTDAAGEFRARYLPPGRITVNAVFADGKSVRGRRNVGAGASELLELVLAP